MNSAPLQGFCAICRQNFSYQPCIGSITIHPRTCRKCSRDFRLLGHIHFIQIREHLTRDSMFTDK